MYGILSNAMFNKTESCSNEIEQKWLGCTRGSAQAKAVKEAQNEHKGSQYTEGGVEKAWEVASHADLRDR